jgi:hypothetical protein
MKKFIKIISICLLISIITLSCNDDDDTAGIVIESPTAATLIFPENNTVCNEGTIVSETETEVLFQWQEGINTSSYVLQINNLNEGTSRNINTLSTEFSIRIFRGTPYSWSVKSVGSDGNESTESAVWSFYNAGLPVENHAPFPATVVSPQSGSSINQGMISLEWQASDVDNDIASYTVFFDTVNPPITEVGTMSSTTTEVSISSGLVYYWRVITTDEIGNASTSQVFQFVVN